VDRRGGVSVRLVLRGSSHSLLLLRRTARLVLVVWMSLKQSGFDVKRHLFVLVANVPRLLLPSSAENLRDFIVGNPWVGFLNHGVVIFPVKYVGVGRSGNLLVLGLLPLVVHRVLRYCKLRQAHHVKAWEPEGFGVGDLHDKAMVSDEVARIAQEVAVKSGAVAAVHNILLDILYKKPREETFRNVVELAKQVPRDGENPVEGCELVFKLHPQIREVARRHMRLFEVSREVPGDIGVHHDCCCVADGSSCRM